MGILSLGNNYVDSNKNPKFYSYDLMLTY